MSRTEGFSLPRIPASHSRVAVPSKTWASSQGPYHSRSLSEPAYYTSYLCCPRQDVPGSVLRDPTACDEVFDKVGRDRELPRLAGKVDTPLTTSEYNSLHDPHVRDLYLNNKSLRRHLIRNGLVTDELRVVGKPQEYRQHVRSHEILERKEQLQRKLEQQEINRVSKIITNRSQLPKLVMWGMDRVETRRAYTQERYTRQTEERYQRLQNHLEEQELQKAAKKQVLLARQHEQQIEEDRKREERRQQQEELFNVKYNDKFADLPNGVEVAAWHREAEILEHRIQVMEYLHWGRDGRFGAKDNDLLRYLDTVNWDQKMKEVLAMPKRRMEEARIGKELAEIEAESQNVGRELDDVKVELQTELDALAQEDKEVIRPQEPVAEVLQEVAKETDPFQEVLMETFSSGDESNSGFLTLNSFWAVLNSRALDLQLSDDEMQYLLSQTTQTTDGLVAYREIVPIMKDMLQEIFRERAEVGLDMGESPWKMLYSPSRGHIYFHKETGKVELLRPSDYIPPFRDEFFWETMSDIFTTADINHDGVLDRNEFFLLLQSENVGLRLSEEQRVRLLELFDSMGVAAVAFEDFIPLARIIIMMVYQSQYSSETPWVELSSTQYGPFWYNRITGEVLLNPPADINVAEAGAGQGKPGVLSLSMQDSSRSARSSVTRSLGVTLPPIEEVTDRDTLGGSLDSASLIRRSPSLDIPRPGSPLPPESTPEVDNRPETSFQRDVPDSRGSQAVSPESQRGRERHRHRAKQARSRQERSSSREDRPREPKSRGHSRRRRRHREKPVVEDQPIAIVAEKTKSPQEEGNVVNAASQSPVPAGSEEDLPVNVNAEAAEESAQQRVDDQEETETQAPAASAQSAEEGDQVTTKVDCHPEGAVDNRETGMSMAVNVSKGDKKVVEEADQDQASDGCPTKDEVQEPRDVEKTTPRETELQDVSEANAICELPKSAEADGRTEDSVVDQATEPSLPVEEVEPQNPGVQETLAVELETVKSSFESALANDSSGDKTEVIDGIEERQLPLAAEKQGNTPQPPTDSGTENSQIVQSDHEHAPTKELNLADDDKISLGIASTNSLPKPTSSRVDVHSRAGSASTSRRNVGQMSPSASLHQSQEALIRQSPTASVSGLMSRSKTSETKMSVEGESKSVAVEDQPLTDQEKLASRRSSLIEA